MMKKLVLLLFSAALLLTLTACGEEQNNAVAGEAGEPLRICLDWTPNINHAGIYAAQELGYFAEEGLEVSIVQPGDNYALQLVAAGQAELGVSYQEEVTFAREQNIPVISVAAVLQHNTSCFAAPADRGITSPAQFGGKVYGGWSGQVELGLLNWLQQKYDYEQPVSVIDLGSSDFFAATESGRIDFSWIFYGVTGIEARLRQTELDLIWVKDLAPELDYYTPVLVMEEGWLADNEETAQKLLRAISKGYCYAAEHPSETADLLLAAVPELDEEMIHSGMEWIADRYLADSPAWGIQKAEVWQGFGDWLYEQDMLEQPFDGGSAFTNDCLPQ